MNEGVQALIAMAQMVYQTQDCVLEVTIFEGGIAAHLIPKTIWEEEGGDFDE